jgi:hypothetical protein
MQSHAHAAFRLSKRLSFNRFNEQQNLHVNMDEEITFHQSSTSETLLTKQR